ncbi:MAG: PIG-L family deacetylase [Deferribacteraceae bacterium]|jgi:4-oxalomesaconate hydratase|nr:PIG-L family deacetylase [Deferribacteraceae bacterium]
MIQGKKVLVVSAHAADYVWRSGGTIAKYIKNGATVKVVVLSYGVRGESNDLWNQEGATAESVKSIRSGETTAAAKILGVSDIEFWDLDDYPMTLTKELEDRMVRTMRAVQPDIIITHDKIDVLNPDHNQVSDFVFRCSIMSNSNGVRIEGTKTTKQMRLFGFEPHQTELSSYVPGSFIDITEAYEQKVAAMQCFKAQGHLIEYYTQRAFLRGNHARRISGNKSYKYAESFANFFPVVGEELY